MSDTKAFNARLPRYTTSQINVIVKQTGMTKTQVVMTAIERLYADLNNDDKKPEIMALIEDMKNSEH